MPRVTLACSPNELQAVRAQQAPWGDREREFIRKAESLKEALKDPNRQEAAKKELRQLATPDVVRHSGQRILEKDLDPKEAARILAALYAVDELGLPAVSAIIRATESGTLLGKLPSSNVNHFAYTLRQHPESWELLLPLTSDANPTVRAWAIGIGGSMMDGQPRLAETWFQFALDTQRSAEDRAAAILAIAGAQRIGPTMVNRFLEIMISGDEQLRWAVERALTSHPEESLTILADRLASVKPPAQLAILDCLTRMRETANGAKAAIREELGSDSAEVRVAAARAYWYCAREAEPVVAVLKQELAVRPTAAAIRLASELGPQAAPLGELLADLLLSSRSAKTYDPLIPGALGEIGPAARPQLDSLLACLDDEPTKWFCAIVVACARVSDGPSPAIDKLDQRIKSRLAETAATVAHSNSDSPGQAATPIDGDLRLLVNAARRIGPHAAPLSGALTELLVRWAESAYRALPQNALVEIGPAALSVLEQTAARTDLSDKARQGVERTIERIKRRAENR
jgi:hypothetical protein